MHGRYLTGESATYGRFWAVWALDDLSGQTEGSKRHADYGKSINAGAPGRRGNREGKFFHPDRKENRAVFSRVPGAPALKISMAN
jgi:hypothetical protein